MVEKKKAKSVSDSKNESKVTRIKAADTKAVKAKKISSPKPKRDTPKILKPFESLGGYFKGAWNELREVRWPTRRATWGLTLAVILFSLLLAAVILLLDALFNFVFDQIIR